MGVRNAETPSVVMLFFSVGTPLVLALRFITLGFGVAVTFDERDDVLGDSMNEKATLLVLRFTPGAFTLIMLRGVLTDDNDSLCKFHIYCHRTVTK